jgi:hypothetical protein
MRAKAIRTLDVLSDETGHYSAITNQKVRAAMRRGEV